MKQKTFPLGDKEIPLKLQPVIEHARCQIMQNGVRNFTIEKLASDLKISKKTIYKYFSTKEEFVEKVLLYNFADLFTKVRNLPEHPEDPLKHILMVLNIILNHVSVISSSSVYEVKLYYPNVWKQVEEFRQDLMRNLNDAFMKAQRMGLIRKNLEMSFITEMIMNIVQTIFQPEFFINYSYSISEMIRMFIDFIMNGLMEKDKRFDIAMIDEIKE
ncbi:MAG: TetR/AcrR family transcriptional regulator [Candidatus Marinimicrobia bacterium]|nr:TetR/AcrR family transcriptional regulator [Candidatus Neomarinimicrobiota bacterium]